MAKIRIMIVDDHEYLRLGVRTVFELEPDLAVVGEASNGEEARAKIGVLDPQVVLMDVRMEKMNGIEACREIKSLYPAVHILMFTSYSDDNDAFVSAVLAGASGYLLKNVRRAELLRAIRQAATGQTLLDANATKQLMERLQMQTAGSGLTDREREVLVLVAHGYTNKQIAEALCITEKTARNHVSHILEKLELSRRSEVGAYVYEHRLVPPRERAAGDA